MTRRGEHAAAGWSDRRRSLRRKLRHGRTRLVAAWMFRPRAAFVVRMPWIWSLAWLRRRRAHWMTVTALAFLGWLATLWFADPVSLTSGHLGSWDWLLIALAASLVGVVFVRGNQGLSILPFQPVTDGEQDSVSVIASSFADRLDVEMRRINQLMALDVFQEPAVVGASDEGHGWQPRRQAPRAAMQSREEFTTGRAATGAWGEIPTDVAQLAVGPLRLSIGALVTLVRRVSGRTLGGTIAMASGHIEVLVSLGGRHGQRWLVPSENEPAFDIADGGATLARRLACRILWDELGVTNESASSGAFEELAGGIEAYEAYLTAGRVAELEKAVGIFGRVVVHSPGYAAAHHNLACVLRERLRLGRGSPATDVGCSEALWAKAVALDPDLGSAWLQLAAAAYNRAKDSLVAYRDEVTAGARSETGSPTRVREINRSYETAIERSTKALDAAERTEGKKGAAFVAASYWLGRSLCDEAEVGALYGAGLDRSVARQSLRHLRHARRALVEIKFRRGNTATGPVETRLGKVIATEIQVRRLLLLRTGPHDERAQRRHKWRRKWRRWRACQALSALLRWAVQHGAEEPNLHHFYGEALALQGRQQKSARAFLRAVELDSSPARLAQAAETLAKLDPATAEQGDLPFEDASRALRVAVAQRSDDAGLWSLLAEYERYKDRYTASLLLAGRAVVLDPKRHEPVNALGVVWASIRSWQDAELARRGQMACAAYAVLLQKDPPPPRTPLPDAPREEYEIGVGLQQWFRAWKRWHEWRAQRVEAPRRAALLKEIEKRWRQLDSHLFEFHLAGFEIGRCWLQLAAELDESDLRERACALLQGALQVMEGELGDNASPALGDLYETGLLELGDLCLEIGDDEHRELGKRAFEIVVDRPREVTVATFDTGGLGRTVPVLMDPAVVPRYARALSGLAEVHRDEAPKVALEYLSRAIAAAPHWPWPHYLRHLIAVKEGRFDEAANELDLVAETMSDELSAFLARARAHVFEAEADEAGDDAIRVERRQMAIRCLRQAIATSRDDHDQYVLRLETSRMLFAWGDRSEAIAELRRALATHAATRDVDAWQFHLQLADALTETFPVEARNALDSAARSAPPGLPTANVLNARAWFLSQRCIELEEANEAAEQAISIASEHDAPADLLSSYLDTWGWVAHCLGQHYEAIDRVQRALRAGDNAVHWYHYGVILAAAAEELHGKQRRALRARSVGVFRHVARCFPSSEEAAMSRSRLERLPDLPDFGGVLVDIAGGDVLTASDVGRIPTQN